MKKITLSILMLLIAAVSFSQIRTYQIAFGAKAVDSVVGGAPAGGTIKYYYFNYAGTVAAGKVVSTAPIRDAEISAIQVAYIVPTKAADVSDSMAVEIQISYDNTNWFKWTNAGAATVAASQTQYWNGPPTVSGSAAYVYAGDRVSMTTTAGACLFQPKNCRAPYVRVKTTTWKASSSAYVKAYVQLTTLK